MLIGRRTLYSFKDKRCYAFTPAGAMHYPRRPEPDSMGGKFRLQGPERVDPPSSQYVGPLGGRLSRLLVQRQQQQESDWRQRKIRWERARFLQPRQFDTFPETSRYIHVGHIDIKPQASPRQPWSSKCNRALLVRYAPLPAYIAISEIEIEPVVEKGNYGSFPWILIKVK